MQHLPRGVISAAVAGLLVMAGAVWNVSAAGDSLRIEPRGITVVGDETFTMRVVQSAARPISAAQATVTFDPALLQVTSVTRGDGYAGSQLFLPMDIAGSIATANTSGSLLTVAAAFFPPASVAPGEAEFLVIGFRAIGCGEAAIGLPVGPADASLLDGTEAAYGVEVEVLATGSTVTIDCGAGSGSADASPVAATAFDGTQPIIAAGLVAVIAVGGGTWLLRRTRA